MSHVVVAPDKFKGTLTATQVAAHVAAGLARVRPDLAVVQAPVADGGDGTVDAAEAAGYRRVQTGVRGPTGQPVVAVAGVCSLSPAQLRAAGIARAYALTDIEPDVTRCREQAGPLLEDLAERVARDWLVP